MHFYFVAIKWRETFWVIIYRLLCHYFYWSSPLEMKMGWMWPLDENEFDTPDLDSFILCHRKTLKDSPLEIFLQVLLRYHTKSTGWIYSTRMRNLKPPEPLIRQTSTHVHMNELLILFVIESELLLDPTGPFQRPTAVALWATEWTGANKPSLREKIKLQNSPTELQRDKKQVSETNTQRQTGMEEDWQLLSEKLLGKAGIIALSASVNRSNYSVHLCQSRSE